MRLIVNGKPMETDATRVAELVEALGLTGRAVAVEVNREVVPKRRHDEAELSEGDTVELVTLVGGGVADDLATANPQECRPMSPKEMMKHLAVKPFQPFVVVTSGGDRHRVNHPENIKLAENNCIYIFQPSRSSRAIVQSPDIVSLLHVTTLEPIREAAA